MRTLLFCVRVCVRGFAWEKPDEDQRQSPRRKGPGPEAEPERSRTAQTRPARRTACWLRSAVRGAMLGTADPANRFAGWLARESGRRISALVCSIANHMPAFAWQRNFLQLSVFKQKSIGQLRRFGRRHGSSIVPFRTGARRISGKRSISQKKSPVFQMERRAGGVQFRTLARIAAIPPSRARGAGSRTGPSSV